MLIEMNSKLPKLISYINDNLRFGSKIQQTVIDKWFKEYSLNLEDKLVVYKELKLLNIEVIDYSKGLLKSKIGILLKSIEKNQEIKKSTILKWFRDENIEHGMQEKVITSLEKQGYTIIDDFRQAYIGLNFDFLNNIEDDDLNSLLENQEFIDKVDSLKNVVDKSHNIEYLVQLNSEDSKKREIALDNLVEANDRLVWKIVMHYSKLATISFDMNDMYQVGMQGLLKAAEKFDISLGYQFSTYAIWWIRQAITRGIADFSTSIRIPVHYREKMNKFIRIENQLWNDFGRPATRKELSKELGISEKENEEINFFIFQSSLDSLDRPIGNEEGSYLGDFLSDKNMDTPENEYTQFELRKIIEEVLNSTLSEKEKKIIYFRFGLYDGREHTLDEIGKVFKVTRERIRQIEAKALRKLRQSKASRILKEFLNDY